MQGNKFIVFGGLEVNTFCCNSLFVLEINPENAKKHIKNEVKRLKEQTIKAFKGTLTFKRTKHTRNKFFNLKVEGKCIY